MNQITDPNKIEEYKKTARDRYYSISRNDYGPEIFEGNALMVYHLTSDGLNFHIVEIDRDDSNTDDISSVLEWAFHDIKDRSAKQYFDDTIFQIMGAVKREELDEDLAANDEYVELDCGYVLPGLLEIAEAFEVEDEYSHTPSATFGDYSPSHPWDAPGMSIHDFI